MSILLKQWATGIAGGQSWSSYWATRTYTERVNHYFGSNIVAHYPLNEVAGVVAQAYGEAPVFTNLMPNSGLEGYTAGGYGISGAGATVVKTITAGEFHAGAAALKVTSAGATAICYKSVSVIPGQKYVLDFWVRGDGTNAPLYDVIREDAGAYIIGFTNTLVTGTNFVHITSAEFTAPATFYTVLLEFRTVASAGAFFCLDDVTVTQTSSAASINNLSGEYKKATLNQAGFRTGENSVYFNGSSGSGVRLGSLINNELADMSSGTILIWCKPAIAALTDGVARWAVKFKTTSLSAEANYIDIYKSATNNKIGFQFKDDTMAEAGLNISQTAEEWICMAATWSPSQGLKRFINGVQTGATVAISGTWTKIMEGEISAIGVEVRKLNAGMWHGWLSHCVIGKTALSDEAMLYLGQTL